MKRVTPSPPTRTAAKRASPTRASRSREASATRAPLAVVGPESGEDRLPSSPRARRSAISFFIGSPDGHWRWLQAWTVSPQPHWQVSDSSTSRWVVARAGRRGGVERALRRAGRRGARAPCGRAAGATKARGYSGGRLHRTQMAKQNSRSRRRAPSDQLASRPMTGTSTGGSSALGRRPRCRCGVAPRADAYGDPSTRQAHTAAGTCPGRGAVRQVSRLAEQHEEDAIFQAHVAALLPRRQPPCSACSPSCNAGMRPGGILNSGRSSGDSSRRTRR